MYFKPYIDKRGEFRWALKADNGKTIADSGEGYKNYSDLEHAIALVQSSWQAEVGPRPIPLNALIYPGSPKAQPPKVNSLTDLLSRR